MAAFRGLDSHTWLVATTQDTADLEHSHGGRKLSWTALVCQSGRKLKIGKELVDGVHVLLFYFVHICGFPK